MYLCQYTVRGTVISGLVLVLVLMLAKCRINRFKEFENGRQFSLITSGTCPKCDQLPSQCQWTTSIENAFKHVCSTAVRDLRLTDWLFSELFTFEWLFPKVGPFFSFHFKDIIRKRVLTQ